MFQQPEALNPQRHAALGLSEVPDYTFAAEEMLTPVFSGEAWHIAREYTLVFPREGGLPLAILGIQQGVNAYVGSQPAWWGRYVPAHIRRYPFVAAPQTTEDGEQAFTVMIDRQAPQLLENGGQPLFEEDGPSQLLQEVQRVLGNLEKDASRTRQLVEQIDAAGLLVERSLYIHVKDGEDRGLKGFRVIDREAFRQCDGETLAALNRTGALDLIQAHFCSLTNLRDGLLAKKAAGKLDAAAPGDAEATLDDLFGEDGDDLTFNFDD